MKEDRKYIIYGHEFFAIIGAIKLGLVEEAKDLVDGFLKMQNERWGDAYQKGDEHEA